MVWRAYVSTVYSINTETQAYGRIVTAGFTIDPDIWCAVYYAEEARYWKDLVRINFNCTCGKREGADIRLNEDFKDNYVQNNKIDAARYIEDLGAISPEHLRDDGYTTEEIAHIRRAYG